MILGRRFFLGGAAALALPFRVAAQAPAPALDELVARNTEARGGAAALDRVRACLIELDIAEGGQTVQGRYAARVDGLVWRSENSPEHAAAPERIFGSPATLANDESSVLNQNSSSLRAQPEDQANLNSSTLVRIDIHAGGNLVYREGVDRAGVWQWPGDAAMPRPSVAEGAANALLHGAENHLFGLHRFRERGHALRLMPSERLDGADHPVVEVRYRTGHVSYFYVDPASWQLVRRRDVRAYHPDVDPTRQRVETLFSDFRAVDGVVAPHRNHDRDLATGATLSTIQVTRRVLNPDLDEAAYVRTAAPLAAAA